MKTRNADIKGYGTEGASTSGSNATVSSGEDVSALKARSSSSSSSCSDEGEHIGTLWGIRYSPFSIVAKIVLNLSSRTAKYVNHMPILSTLTMCVRVLLNRRIPPMKLTAPVLQASASPHEFYYDTFNIARYIDSNRHSNTPTLFPSSHMSSITMFNVHAQTIISHARALLLSRLQSDMAMTELLYVPRWLRGKTFITGPLLRLGLFLMSLKYSPESKKATHEKTREALLAVREALANHHGVDLKYLVAGRLTFADIIVAQAISFDSERYPSKYANVYINRALAEEFPDIVAWSRAVRETHCNLAAPTQPLIKSS